MSTTAVTPTPHQATAAAGGPSVRRPDRPAPAPIPTSRLLLVELRKMFDTRSGFWLLASIGILCLLATSAVILWAPEDELTYETFASAIGFPMNVVLPMVAILSVTGEWSQRSGLTSFTLVPHRGRVITAKLVCAVGIGVVSMLFAAVVGALGNVVGTALTGAETTWNVSLSEFAMIVVANVLSLLVGFMLGVLLRSSPAAIVAYFVYSFVLPGATSALAAAQEWYRDLGPWIDFNYASSALFEGVPDAEQWAQIGTSGLIWLFVPLAIGLRLVMRSEVK